MVTRAHGRDVRADLFDDARPFVPQERGSGEEAGELQVGTADADADDTDEHLVRAGFVQVHLGQDEGLSGLLQQSGGSAHQVSFVTRIARSHLDMRDRVGQGSHYGGC